MEKDTDKEEHDQMKNEDTDNHRSKEEQERPSRNVKTLENATETLLLVLCVGLFSEAISVRSRSKVPESKLEPQIKG